MASAGKAPLPRKESPGRSPQSRLLRRRLAASLGIGWAAYTAVFVLLALLLNATFVPYVANKVADATSEWQRWEYADYPLEKCLAITNMDLVGVAPGVEEAEYVASLLSEFHGDALVPDDNVAVYDADGEQRVFKVLDEASGVVAYDVGVPDEEVARKIEEATAAATAALEGGAEDELATQSLILKDADGFYDVFSLIGLQQEAIVSSVLPAGYLEMMNWQVAYDGEGVSARELTFYNAAKQLKFPVAIGLYLLGCIVLVLRGYGRAMRYFDELTNAVGGLIADKEKPVELPGALRLAQDELNAIRLASLADERAAKSAERRKDELVAYLAHDVKTPLTSVIGYLMLLEEAPDMPAEQRGRYVATAADKAQRLESLIDEFFEITRYNLHAIPVERSNVDVRLLLEQVADEFYPEAQARGLSIEVDAPEDGSIFVDPGKFARALGNVVRNAVAYADRDTDVVLSAREEGPGWRIEVENQGREISEAHLQSIFEKFYREDAARGTASGGAGLGLAIAKEIVVAHGGEIGAESERGVTTFTIVVPA